MKNVYFRLYSFVNVYKRKLWSNMVTNKEMRTLALSFAEAEEQPHFEKTSFRVKKKIFATLDEANQKAVLKLSDVDQGVFSAASKAIYPVPNKWGKQGWTIVELKNVRKDLFKDILTTSYCTVAPQKLSSLYRNDL